MGNDEKKAYRNDIYFTLGSTEGIEDPVGEGSSVSCSAIGDAGAYTTIWKRAKDKYKTDAGYLSWQDLASSPDNKDPVKVYAVWGGLINKYALGVGISPFVVAAIMAQESGGDCCALGLDSPGTTCPTDTTGGAVCGTTIGYGLMQITGISNVPPVTITSRNDACGGISAFMNRAIREKFTSTVAGGGSTLQPNSWVGPASGANRAIRTAVVEYILKNYNGYIKYKAACDAVVPAKTCVWWIGAGYNGGRGFITDSTYRNKLANGGVGSWGKGVYQYAEIIAKNEEKIRTTLMG